MPQYRPGQRQQERMQRLARRQKRRRIVLASTTATVIVVAGVVFAIWFQNYTIQQTALANTHATATTDAGNKATATAITTNCFLTAGGPTVPAIYDGSATPSSGPDSSPSLSGTPVVLKDGLKYVDIVVGKGTAAKEGSTITANYSGWLASTCAKFGSSYDSEGGTPGSAFTTQLSSDQVLAGWVEGVAGMKPGGIRRLYLPSALAYGANGQQDSSGNQVIPANANLIFDVTLLSVK